MKQNEEKVDLDTRENNEDVRSPTIKDIVDKVKRYKREVANLHRALGRIQKDKEQLLSENIKLKELLNKN